MSKPDPAHVALAEEHVRRGREIVAKQRAMTERARKVGLPTHESESLTATFERTQAIFEDDLERLRRMT